MELTSTATHFSLLSALPGSPILAWEDLVNQSRVEESTDSKYIRTLEDLRIVDSANPIFAPTNARRRRHRVADPFVSFWFRFVFPFQADLMAGLDPGEHYDRNVAPHLSEHASWIFEHIAHAWARRRFASTADTVSSWWGSARHDLRREGRRATEEIGVLGGRGSRAAVIGECRWQSQAMKNEVLDDLLRFKIPTLAQSGIDTGGAEIVLFSKSGFTPGLQQEAERLGNVVLDLETLAEGL